MKIAFDGTEYDFDLDEITISQATTIKRKTGLSLLALERGMTEVDPDAMRAIYWLMLVQNGRSVDLDRVDFKPVLFSMALYDAIQAAAKEKDAADAATDVPKDE